MPVFVLAISVVAELIGFLNYYGTLYMYTIFQYKGGHQNLSNVNQFSLIQSLLS